MKAKIKHAFSLAATGYDSVAYLQRGVAEDLLTLINHATLTGAVLDLGCGTGFLSQTLVNSRDSTLQHLIALDIAPPMLSATRDKLSTATHQDVAFHYLCADAEALPLSHHCLDAIVSNLALQWCVPLSTVLNECKRTLKSGGSLIFSTFGRQTLHELKTAWANIDEHTHVNQFYDAAQLQQLLVQAAFSEIHIETQHYVSYYDSALSLMRELKQLGAHSVIARQQHTMTTRGALTRMMTAYTRAANNTQISATFEVLNVIAKA